MKDINRVVGDNPKKRCPHTNQICTLRDKCSECWLTDVWCADALEYIVDLLCNLSEKEE